MKSTKFSKNIWHDHYSQKAQKEGYPARSVYKLQEIQKKFKILRKRDHILDLGCAPGSWLIYAANLTGLKGSIMGIDLKSLKIKLPANARFIQDDIFNLSLATKELLSRKFDVVLSDMAPFSSGNQFTDGVRSFQLCIEALALSEKVLKPGGHFICKIFQGEDFKLFSDMIKEQFKQVHIFKPKSSRKASREIFTIGKNRR